MIFIKFNIFILFFFRILHSTPSSTEPSTSTSSPLTRELQIEYWTTSNYPCSPPAFTQQATQSFHNDFCSPSTSNISTTSGSKFSMKASVRTLSIAREPLNHLLSILFVKERKKDKVLQKLGRRSKQVLFLRFKETCGEDGVGLIFFQGMFSKNLFGSGS